MVRMTQPIARSVITTELSSWVFRALNTTVLGSVLVGDENSRCCSTSSLLFAPIEICERSHGAGFRVRLALAILRASSEEDFFFKFTAVRTASQQIVASELLCSIFSFAGFEKGGVKVVSLH